MSITLGIWTIPTLITICMIVGMIVYESTRTKSDYDFPMMGCFGIVLIMFMWLIYFASKVFIGF